MLPDTTNADRALGVQTAAPRVDTRRHPDRCTHLSHQR
jgi:hypothetical protein